MSGASLRSAVPVAPALAQRIARFARDENRVDTDIPGLSLHRWPHPTEPTSYNLAPSICLIGQGRKRLFLGDETFVYEANKFLVTSVDLPVVSQIVAATEDEPYLGLTLELDLKMLARLMLEQAPASRPAKPEREGIAVSELSPRLSGAVERLLDLLDEPESIPALAPLLKQEICFRLLASDQGARLRQIVSSESQGHQIARALNWLKDHFDEPLHIKELADRAGLSTSAFHNHFRNLTAMSPLQYQKKLRLNEARRLMLTEHMEAATAAYEVGYESPSQFSREYSRAFGAPPIRDIRNLVEQQLT